MLGTGAIRDGGGNPTILTLPGIGTSGVILVGAAGVILVSQNFARLMRLHRSQV